MSGVYWWAWLLTHSRLLNPFPWLQQVPGLHHHPPMQSSQGNAPSQSPRQVRVQHHQGYCQLAWINILHLPEDLFVAIVVGDFIRGHFLRMGSMSSSAPTLTTQASLTMPRMSSSTSVTSIKSSRRTSQSARTSWLPSTVTLTRQVRHASNSSFEFCLHCFQNCLCCLAHHWCHWRHSFPACCLPLKEWPEMCCLLVQCQHTQQWHPLSYSSRYSPVHHAAHPATTRHGHQQQQLSQHLLCGGYRHHSLHRELPFLLCHCKAVPPVCCKEFCIWGLLSHHSFRDHPGQCKSHYNWPFCGFSTPTLSYKRWEHNLLCPCNQTPSEHEHGSWSSVDQSH